MAHDSKYLLYRNILNIATLYKDNVFFLPCFMDFRGRIYTVSTYLNYQASDISRSLFLFSRASYSYDLDFLYIYLANTYGKTKISRKLRIE